MLLGCLEARLPWWDLTMSNSFLLLGKDGGCECPLKRTGKPLSSYNPGTFSLIWLSSGENTGGGHPGWEGALAGQRCLGKTVSARVASNMADGLAGKCLKARGQAGGQAASFLQLGKKWPRLGEGGERGGSEPWTSWATVTIYFILRSTQPIRVVIIPDSGRWKKGLKASSESWAAS